MKNIVRFLNEPEFYEYKHRGVAIWEVIKRRTIVSNFEQSDSAGSINHSEFNGRRLLVTIYNTIVSVVKIFLAFKKKDYLFIGFSRRIKVNDGYLDLYHDHLIRSIGEDKCLMLERPLKGAHLKPRSVKYGVIYLDFMCYLSEVLSRLFFLKHNSAGFEGLKAQLEQCGVKPPPLISVNRETNKFKVEAWFARFLLSRIKPKSITITSKWLHLPFVMAANEKGIPVYEVQHGARFYYNLAYQGFGNFNKYRVDGVLTMGDAWNSFPWESPNVISIGNSNFTSATQHSCEFKGKSNSLLYISQPGIWETVRFDVARLAEKNPEFEITLRFHPKDIGNLERRYGDLRRIRNIIFEFPEGDVAESIMRHSLVVGYTSTVLFQAADLGVRTALMVGKGASEDDYADMFGDMINSFFLIKNYELESINELSRGAAREFFSPFKSDVWRAIIDGERGE